MLIYYSFNNSYWLATFEMVLNLKTQGFQGIFRNILIIFGGAYRYRCATCCLKQISKYITLKSTNNILNIT